MRAGPACLRRARLTIAKPRSGSYFATEPNALQVEELQVQFSIKKSLRSTPNPATLSITNLAESTRDELAKLPQVAVLEVSYGDAAPERLFIGDVFYVGHEWDGPTVVTKLQAHDGGRAYAHARVTQSFKAGAVVLDAVKAAAAGLGLKLPPPVLTMPQLQQAATAGLALAGRASDELSRLLTPLGLGWSVQDGNLVVLDERGVRPGQAIVIDEAAGMIDSPKWSTPSKPGKRPTLSLQCLLFPEVAPGNTIQVRSKTANGLFKVTDVSHEGDTMGGDWLTTIEARAVG
jgi:hypothetical protein